MWTVLSNWQCTLAMGQRFNREGELSQANCTRHATLLNAQPIGLPDVSVTPRGLPSCPSLRSVVGRHHIAMLPGRPEDQVILFFLLGDVPRAEGRVLTVESIERKEVSHADFNSRVAGHGDGPAADSRRMREKCVRASSRVPDHEREN